MCVSECVCVGEWVGADGGPTFLTSSLDLFPSLAAAAAAGPLAAAEKLGEAACGAWRGRRPHDGAAGRAVGRGRMSVRKRGRGAGCPGGCGGLGGGGGGGVMSSLGRWCVSMPGGR